MSDPVRDLRDLLPRLVVFVAVVRHGSFRAAADELGLSRSVVSTDIAKLEDRLGVQLLMRSSRHLSTTDAGEQLFARARSIIDEAEDALARAVSAEILVEGASLKVTCPAVVAERIVLPALTPLAKQGVRVNLHIDDSRVNLIAEGYDVGVRVGIPRDSDLVIHRLGDLPEQICCAPELLGDGDPEDPDFVRGLPWISHVAVPPHIAVTSPEGEKRVLRFDPVVRTNATEGLLGFLRAGVGAAVLPSYLSAPDIAAGRLVAVLNTWTIRNPVSVFALTTSKRVSPATRLFLDSLRASVGALHGEPS